jgi:hypothetical protein
MAAGIWFSSAPTTPMLSIRFANGHINAQHAAGSAASGIDVGYSAASNADDLEFENIKIYDCPRDGVRIGALSSPKAIDFANMQIFHNGVEAGYHGVRIAAGASGIRIRNSTVGNRSFGTAGVQTYGIAAEGNLSDSMIAGNDLSLNGAGPLILAGTFSGLIENNKGIDDVMTQGIASAATITVGVYRFYKVTGTAVIATINGGITGQRKTLQFTDAAPGGVSAAGNIYTAKTAAQNATVTLQFDGTKWVVM